MEWHAEAPASIDAYIAHCPEDVQPILQKIREVIHETAPNAVEKISYKMPAFALNGVLVWFAAHKTYIGFYPTGEGVEAFKLELSGYVCTKGSIHFPLDQTIPYDLIRKIVKYRVAATAKK